jgi:hypothetical protein
VAPVLFGINLHLK